MSFFFIPGVLWVFLLFCISVIVFTPMRMLEAINISAKVAWANWKIVLPCAIIAFSLVIADLSYFFRRIFILILSGMLLFIRCSKILQH